MHAALLLQSSRASPSRLYNTHCILSKFNKGIMIQNAEEKAKEERNKDLADYFPRKPYEIQMNIAEMLYQTLQKGKVKLAIIESPTGTGKTYSLLVPLIAWLSKNRANIKDEKSQSQKKVNIPSWLKKPSQQKVEKLLSEKKKRAEEAIDISQAQKELKKARLKHTAPSKQEQEIEVSSQDQNNNFKRNHQKKLEMMVEKQLKVEDQAVLPKIIFISRTHSQLSQVIESVKSIMKQDKEMKYLQVASKDHLCINTSINTSKTNISERCQYILDHSKCEFFHNLSIKQFFNNNIEEAVTLGSNHHLCPYYGTRNLIEGCDIICLPYASILNSEIRNRIGINLHNSIVVFDQGHNVIDNEKQLHSPEISLEDIAVLTQQIDEYLKKYGERLKIANSKLLIHLLEILRAMIITSQKLRKDSPSSEQKKYLKISYLHFIGQLALKQMKIFKIVKYIQLNNLDQKLAYFNSKDAILDKSKPKGNREQEKKISVAKINNILQFLVEFARFDQSQQILLLKWQDSKKIAIKIFCLQSTELSKIIDKSRLTIIAGGTMQPLNDFQPLFEKYQDRFLVKKYPHIIKKSQCGVSIVKRANKREIIFNHQTLNDKNSLEFLRRICLQTILKVMKKTQKGGGIVIFIQNYRLVSFFKETCKNEPFFSRMLFDGKQPQQSKNKDIFESYKQLVQGDKENNHILLSVMGGKLSQGINFSDRLARSLIVFGLPYSNIYAPEVVQAIAYNQKHKKSTKNEYIECLCLRTLNQTIGRGVRHISDYVNIYLIDSRFDGIKHKLSQWMRDRVSVLNDIEDL